MTNRIKKFTKSVLFACLLLSPWLPGAAHADETEPHYQVDMIVFTHEVTPAENNESLPAPLLAPEKKHAIPLTTNDDNTQNDYQVLPASRSLLKPEFRALAQQPNYDILFQTSWMQPEANQKPVILPAFSDKNWQIEGTVQVRKNAFYQFNSDLVFTPTHSRIEPFQFSHQQRLKEDTVYYIDHPHVGILVKIHRVG